MSKSKEMMVWVLGLLVLTILSMYAVSRPAFGKIPTGERKARIEQSEHYRSGMFHNVEPTEQLTVEGQSRLRIFWNFLFGPNDGRRPKEVIPVVKTDLRAIDRAEDILVWFGHSSYFIQKNGIHILVDPVFSGYSSPFPFFSRAFKGTDAYGPEDMPEIDYLIITHDHYDHLDYHTVRALKDRVDTVICGLGVGSHLEYWGYPAQKIVEMEWGEKAEFPGLTVYGCTTRHFSGRSLQSNKTMWMAFALEFSNYKIYVGGDGGYGKHFAEIGRNLGPFDLAILENGQYNENWRFIHAMPEETVQAAADLRAEKLLPVHHSKFSLAPHRWEEPMERVTKTAEASNFPLSLPQIGQIVSLDGEPVMAHGLEIGDPDPQ